MFVVEKGIGRVIHARIVGLADADEVERYRLSFLPHFASLAQRSKQRGQAPDASDERPILWADHRPVRIYTQPVADAIARMFASLNVHWLRVAILASSSNATLAMQLQRIARESNNPSRQVFYEVDRAYAFLGEVLTAEELAGVKSFSEK